VRCLTERHVGRVEVDEVARSRTADALAEVSHTQLDSLQGLGRRSQILFVADGGILVAAVGDVEFSFAVDSEEAVVTGLVHEDQVGGAAQAAGQPLAANGVVVLGAIFGGSILALMHRQRPDQPLDIVPHLDVRVDQLLVAV